ncbi:hypothetical protein C8J57DRAFT_1556876 [Mycena rebaudengoi]|nr:hypothetical protein C8J57DRAFT_1556876 [Mycena rebaudengoi]
MDDEMLTDGALQLLPQTTTSSSSPTPPHGGRYGRLGPAGVWDLTQRASSYWAEYTSRVRRRVPFPIALAPRTGTSWQPPTSPTPSAAATGKRKAPSPTSPSSPTLPTSSKLPPFFQSRLTATAQSRSQLTGRRAASSSASHATSASTTCNSIHASTSGRRSRARRGGSRGGGAGAEAEGVVVVVEVVEMPKRTGGALGWGRTQSGGVRGVLTTDD